MQLESRLERLQYLLQKYLKGKLSLKDQIELSEQLADKKNRIAEEILLDDWEMELDSELTSNRNLNRVLDQVHHRIRLNEKTTQKQLPIWHTFQRVAAILIFPLLLSFLAYFYFYDNQIKGIASYAEIQCPMGVRTKFILPDGSTGFLNSGSTLKYPVQFAGNRTVELSGEAFFEVTHNKEFPFHVNTKNLDIKVLGTTFNVIANEDEKTEEIVLQAGKVDVSSKNGKPLAVLAPNEQLILNIDTNTFNKKVVVASQYTSWKEGKLVFRNENMQQLARRLSRWYNAEVQVDDQLLNDYTFHATFSDEPLDEVLKLLSITTPISYAEEKRTTDAEGTFQKRKIKIQTNKSKIDHFK